MEQLQEYFVGPLGTAVLAFAGAVVAGVLALGGVVVGGWLEGRIQQEAFERQRDLERERQLIQKCELIATTAIEVQHSLVSHIGHMVTYAAIKARGTMSEEGFRELYEQQKQLSSAPLPYLEMLVAFYAPELVAEVEAVKDAREVLNEPIARLARGEVEWTARALAALEQTRLACDGLAQAAAALVQKRLSRLKFPDD